MALSGTLKTSSYDGRYYQLSWTASQSVTNNKSTVSWTLKAVGGNSSWYAERTLKLTLAGSVVYSKTDRVERKTGTIKTGTVTISHDSSGAGSFSAKIEAAVYGTSVNCTGSTTFTLDTIPRKSTLSVSNGTLNTAQTLTVTRKSSSFTHTITATCGSASTTVCSKSSSTSISFTPPLSWASQNTTGTTVSVTYKITTYNGSSSVGSNSYTVSCSIPSSVKPSCSLSVSDSTGNASTYGGYIKGVSKISVSVTATTSHGSAIAAYKTTANSATYTSASFTTDVVKSSGTLSIAATVTDKRGRSGTASASITALDYASPKITKISAVRCNSDGTANDQGACAKVTFSAAITSLSNKNIASYVVKWKKTSESSWTFAVLSSYNNVYSVSGGSYIFEAETGASYDVQLQATDAFGATRSTAKVSTGFTLMHFNADGTGMGIGKISELSNVLDIGVQTRHNAGILQPVLPAGTNLDNLLTPNTYSTLAFNEGNYSGFPSSYSSSNTAMFTLDVCSCGSGSVMQRLTSASKDWSVVWTRFYYSGSWGDWTMQSTKNDLQLWSGALLMTSAHSVTFDFPVSVVPTGIVLVFSEYIDSTVKDSGISSCFISKRTVSAFNGKGFNITCGTLWSGSTLYVCRKYLYISDTGITGNDDNSNAYNPQTGVARLNGRYVLRKVYGV